MANNLNPFILQLMAQSLLALRANLPILSYLNTTYSDQAGTRGSVIDVPIPSALAANDVTPGITAPATQDLNPTTYPITLDKWKEVPFTLTEKEAREIQAHSMPATMSEAISTLSEAIADSVYSNYVEIYSVTGDPAKIAFEDGTNAEAAAMRKILTKQRAPSSNGSRYAIVSPDVTAEMAGVDTFSRADASGDPEVVARGAIARAHGFMWDEDQVMPVHTAGTAGGTGADTVVNGAHSAGATIVSITVGATNPLDLNRGDILTFAGDTQQYAVLANTGSVSPAGTASVSISPALKTALAGGEVVTCFSDGVDYEVNLGAHRDCMAFASSRMDSVELLSALGLSGASGGPMIDVTQVDPVTNLVLRLTVVYQSYQYRIAYSALWGTGVPRPEFGTRLASKVV